MVEGGAEVGHPEGAGAVERAALVGLCSRLVGDRDAAEDLTQETLLEAWRHAHALRDPEKRPQWLAGIARNVCLRWARSRGPERSRLAASTQREGLAHLPDGEVDLELELERDELATLLDRALALLPAETRLVLVQRYVEESPHAEIAALLNLSEDAVSMRLSRGKLALRRALEADLSPEASAYGLPVSGPAAWEETRLWCAGCGRRRLLGRFTREKGEFALRCPDCHLPETYEVRTDRTELVAGVKGYKPAFSRVASWGWEYYARAVRERVLPCPGCGERIELRLRMPEDGPLRDVRGVHTRCGRCGRTYDASLGALAFWTPEAQRLWREHPRLRTLPEREIEAGGRPSILTRFESVVGTASLDVIHARDTYELIEIHGHSLG